ncbi:MAG: EAL domain-containing protein [Campylobacterota bacterium]|nr:EAL domain-containing protein [Campylobacterota bacterium]
MIIYKGKKWVDILDKVDLALQPIVDINTGVCVAHESLLREYKKAGFYSIDDFFDTAFEEKVLFGVDIVLREKALLKFKKIYDKNPTISLFYNIDNRVIKMDDYQTGHTDNLLKKLKLPESCVTFEISEKHEFESFIEAKTIFNLYKEQGYKIALDDFGTGYSGLKMLYYMSPDYIKIDRFFITDILNDNKKKIYVANIVNIAHHSNIQVLAEGVETLDELNVCREIGCNLLQGYYVQRPTQNIDEINSVYKIVAQNRVTSTVPSIDSFNLDDVYYTSNLYNNLIDKYLIASSSNIKGDITSVSEAFCKISKYSKLELIGKPHSILRDKSIPKSIFRDMWKTILSGKVWQGELSNIARDGSVYWVEATISPNYDNNNILLGYTSIRQDITDKKMLEKYIITDHLTGAFNRKHFDEILSNKITQAKTDDSNLTLAILDIDCFKLYNDSYGHNNGDKVLQKISKYIMKIIKKNEYFFRIGGEEFAFIISNNNKKISSNRLNQILKAIEDLEIKHKNSDVSRFVTLSCGAICTNGANLDKNTDLFVSADMMLYRAKQAGKNQLSISNEVYKSSLNIEV